MTGDGRRTDRRINLPRLLSLRFGFFFQHQPPPAAACGSRLFWVLCWLDSNRLSSQNNITSFALYVVSIALPCTTDMLSRFTSTLAQRALPRTVMVGSQGRKLGSNDDGRASESFFLSWRLSTDMFRNAGRRNDACYCCLILSSTQEHRAPILQSRHIGCVCCRRRRKIWIFPAAGGGRVRHCRAALVVLDVRAR